MKTVRISGTDILKVKEAAKKEATTPTITTDTPVDEGSKIFEFEKDGPEYDFKKGLGLLTMYGGDVMKPLFTSSGELTKFALYAEIWGEHPPRNYREVRHLAKKGRKLVQENKNFVALTRRFRVRLNKKLQDSEDLVTSIYRKDQI